MNSTRDQDDVRIAVQGLWLQYQGLMIEAVRTGFRRENAATKTSPPAFLEDLPETGGLLVAS